MDRYGFFFKSSFFAIEPDEENEANTGGDYGRALTRWLTEKLKQRAVSVEDLIVEDWGRLVVVHRAPFNLYVRICGLGDPGGSFTNAGGSFANPINLVEIEYHVYINAERAWIARMFRCIDPEPAIVQLRDYVHAILREVPELSGIEWEDMKSRNRRA